MWLKRDSKLVLKGYEDAEIEMRYDDPKPFLARVGAWSQAYLRLDEAKIDAEQFVVDRDKFESADDQDSLVAPEPSPRDKYLADKGLLT